MVEPGMRRSPAVAQNPWVTLLPPAVRFAFHGGKTARAAAVSAWRVEFSEEACRAHAAEHRATLWLGPDEYLLLDWAASADLAGDLERALAGLPHALVDISHRQFSLAVRGPRVANMLNAACPLDLDLPAFPIGMCTRTVFAKAEIVLWRRGIEEFHVEVWRSFAGYVSGLLAEIAAEFASDESPGPT